MKQEIKERVERIQKGEVPEGYKVTKVGIIPDEWSVKEFNEIFKVNQGLQIPISERHLQKEDNRYFYITNQFLKNNEYDKTFYIENPSKSVICTKSDILMTRTGNTGIVLTDIEGVFHNNFFKLVFDREKYNKDFIFYLLNSFSIQKIIKIYAGTNTIPDLNHGDFYKIQSGIMQKTEQDNIAEILSIWDKAIELKEKLIEEKKELKRGLMQKLLVGKIRFKEYVKNLNLQEVKRYDILPEEWSIKKASSIFSNISKKNNCNEQLLSATQNNGVIPRDMLDGDVMSPSGDTNSYKLVDVGDFVISLRSFQGGLEYSCYRGIVSPAYTVLKNKIPVCKDFYRHLFKSKLFIGRLASSVIGIRDGKQISYDDFSFMLLPYPELKEQEKIAFMLNNIDNNIALLKLELNLFKDQKRGLMQLLLTGIVRVKIEVD